MLGKKSHRLQIQDGQVVVTPEKKGFFRGMIDFYGQAFSNAKDKMKKVVKDRHKGGNRAYYDNTSYGTG